MDVHGGNYSYMSATQTQSVEEEECMEVKKGPWTIEEDSILMNYITKHGEGRWNSLARSAGLRRTGKSCRLRWLNYLRPDVRRGNITLEEQVTIIELHSRWGNRWSKISQQLPGRTDNEIKNYWRTRVQKQAKQLRCDVNSKLFKDTMRHVWIPRLLEKIHAEAAAPAVPQQPPTTTYHANNNGSDFAANHMLHVSSSSETTSMSIDESSGWAQMNSSGFTTENYSMDASSDQYAGLQLDTSNGNNNFTTQNDQGNFEECLISPLGYFNHGFEFQGVEQSSNVWSGSEELWGNLWNVELW